MDLTDTNHIGFQGWVFLGSCPSVGVLKFEDVGSKPFAPRGETRSYGFPSDCMALGQGWDLWPESISDFPTILMWVFSHSFNL